MVGFNMRTSRRTKAVGDLDRMKNPNAKLALNLSLLAIGSALMCAGVRWLFFVGLSLSIFPGALSLRPRKRLRGFALVPLGCLWIGAVSVILWISSFGKEPLEWRLAAVLMFVVTMTEHQYWRENRRGRHEEA